MRYFWALLLSVTAVFAGAAGPKPIMPWLRSVTLGGRIQGISVPLRDVLGAS